MTTAAASTYGHQLSTLMGLVPIMAHDRASTAQNLEYLGLIPISAITPGNVFLSKLHMPTFHTLESPKGIIPYPMPVARFSITGDPFTGSREALLFGVQRSPMAPQNYRLPSYIERPEDLDASIQRLSVLEVFPIAKEGELIFQVHATDYMLIDSLRRLVLGDEFLPITRSVFVRVGKASKVEATLPRLKAQGAIPSNFAQLLGLPISALVRDGGTLLHLIDEGIHTVHDYILSSAFSVFTESLRPDLFFDIDALPKEEHAFLDFADDSYLLTDEIADLGQAFYDRVSQE